MSHMVTMVTSYRQVTMMTRHLVMVPTIPRVNLHTSQTFCLRKAQIKGKFMGVDQWWRFIPWPSYLIKAMIRKRIKPEDLGPNEAHRKSIFHRLSILYVLLTWSALGLVFYWLSKPKKEPTQEEKDMLPHQAEIDRGGAMYWAQALKSPDELLDMKRVRVMKISGFSYKGTEDVTMNLKEIGQEKERKLSSVSDDFYLRKRKGILSEAKGGPSNQELREQFKAEGKDFELELDWANMRSRRRTNYNPDGTVGSFVTMSDIESGQKKAQPLPDPQPEVDMTL
eukprot:TRINITY_DN20006_c1_g1_i1.p1 TRINITY_DN20006_c1_g1~~TRINITY_DN20006_c1_g1_i1.p1  ORF type:complete len:281 (-),score=94.39 TRINITY_DN20006_c1_g1_i1:123-965(-)